MIKNKITDLAYQGEWPPLLLLLHKHLDQINSRREPKGYTPLHQAAWHGASLSVIGEFLSLGADTHIKTNNKQQSAYEIAMERHPDRADLHFVLMPGCRSIPQLMRKLIADSPDLFGAYNGNQIVYDRLIDCFAAHASLDDDRDFGARFAVAFEAVAGVDLHEDMVIRLNLGPDFNFDVDTRFWSSRFLPMLQSLSASAAVIPIENRWAVVADLFDPVPEQWGLRGDMFLWLELRQTLAHVPIPEAAEDLQRVLSFAVATLVGADLGRHAEVYVPRFARGGMSSGVVSGEYWNEKFIPLITQRLIWLQESWRQ